MLPQEQQQLLSAYQSLVVKQLVSQSQASKQQEEEEEAGGKANEAEELDEEVRSIRTQLMALAPRVKGLVLSQRKKSVTEDWTFQNIQKLIELIYDFLIYVLLHVQKSTASNTVFLWFIHSDTDLNY